MSMKRRISELEDDNRIIWLNFLGLVVICYQIVKKQAKLEKQIKEHTRIDEVPVSPRRSADTAEAKK